ncbi:MAG TPA: hypothetical protein VEA59_05015 [Patescibacteria group bacterium]|nr:hypothetical protein [Patescibacteria group bacterium]
MKIPKHVYKETAPLLAKLLFGLAPFMRNMSWFTFAALVIISGFFVFLNNLGGFLLDDPLYLWWVIVSILYKLKTNSKNANTTTED